YDTYGFPPDLTEVICKERGFTADMAGYRQELERARQRSEFDNKEQVVDVVFRQALARVPGESVRLTGYEKHTDTSSVASLILDGELGEEVGEGAEVLVLTAATPFSGEAGGQVGDQGEIVSEGGARLEVTDTTKPVS